jgi:hypothetical protein
VKKGGRRRNKVTTKGCVVGLFILLLLSIKGSLLCPLYRVQAQAPSPPEEKYSTIPTNDTYYITNGTFWKWMKGNFTNKWGKKYQDIVFVFGGCYGGGFVKSMPINDLSDAVAMSASDWDQESRATPASYANPPGGFSYFLESLKEVIRLNPYMLIDDIFKEAYKNDAARPKYETPQVKSKPGTIQGNRWGLLDGMKSNHTIMYCADPDMAAWNDLEGMYKVLRDRGVKESDIAVLYGDGTGKKPDENGNENVVPKDHLAQASLKNLMDAIITNASQGNMFESFMFWFAGHGDNDVKLKGTPANQIVDAYGTYTFPFDVDASSIDAVFSSVSLPSVEIYQWNVTVSDNSVIINGVYVGSLDPLSSVTTLYFGKDQIPFSQFDDTFTIQSNQSTAFALGNITLYSGEVPVQMVYIVPYGPTAIFTESTHTPKVGELVEFDATTSQPGWNGTSTTPITEYRWDFGDGNNTAITAPVIYHTYEQVGTYYVTLTVYAPGTTPDSDTSSAERKVVYAAPVGSYSVPIDTVTTATPPIACFALVAISLASATIVATIATTIHFKRVKRRKEKH